MSNTPEEKWEEIFRLGFHSNDFTLTEYLKKFYNPPTPLATPVVPDDKEAIADEFRMILSHAFLGCDTSDISRETFDLAVNECAKYAEKLNAYHIRRCEAAEEVLKLNYRNIPDSGAYQKWQNTIEPDPESSDGWISVKDRLPEKGQSCLTYPHFKTLPFGNEDGETDYENDFWEWYGDDESGRPILARPYPTHWMPLPNPPTP